MIYDIAFWSCLGWLLQVAEPIILFKRFLGFKVEDYDKPQYKQ